MITTGTAEMQKSMHRSSNAFLYGWRMHAHLILMKKDVARLEGV